MLASSLLCLVSAKAQESVTPMLDEEEKTPIEKLEDRTSTLEEKVGKLGQYAKRQYFGVNGAFNYASNIGMTKFMAEVVLGQQPSTNSSSKSPNDSNNGTSDTYIRNFNGWYVMLVQDLGQSPLSLVAKYDYYDANTKLKKDEVGLNGSSKADLAQCTFGAGLLWKVTGNMNCISLSMLTRRMERIGDHCSNIVEDLSFYLDAHVIKHSN